MERRRHSETYYDILKLRKDCTDKEIRNAFLKLSKEFHPDAKGPKSNATDAAAFVKISEAYRTLSKPQLRKNYDNLLRSAAHSVNNATDSSAFNTGIHRPWEIKPDYNPNPGSYYGIKGLNKMSNAKVAIALIIFGILGGLTGMSLIRYSFIQAQTRLDRISEKANAHHKRLREEVKGLDEQEQLQRVIRRIKGNDEN